jgi:phospholipid/cholesterol/gamma-HCH transport system permease protein
LVALSRVARWSSQSASLSKVSSAPAAKPVREIGGFFALSLDILMQLVRPPFAWREFIEQCWFVAKVSLAPAVMLTIPFNGLVIFMFNVLLIEIGAADISGAGAALAVIAQIGPFTTVLVVGGAGATAMAADLGARAIREELDAMKVIGINPVQRLLVPRVAALTVNAFLLNAIVCLGGLAAAYVFSVYVNHVTPGAFASSLTLLTGLAYTVTSFAKAAIFGLAAGLIACYKGTTVGGGAQGVGNAVNETVVYTFIALFVLNVLLSAIYAAAATT